MKLDKNGRQAVIRQSSGSRQAVVRQSSGSRQAVFRQSSGSHHSPCRQSLGTHQSYYLLCSLFGLLFLFSYVLKYLFENVEICCNQSFEAKNVFLLLQYKCRYGHSRLDYKKKSHDIIDQK